MGLSVILMTHRARWRVSWRYRLGVSRVFLRPTWGRRRGRIPRLVLLQVS